MIPQREPPDTASPAGNPPEHHAPVGLRTLALFEAAKGLLVLLAGFGIFALFHHDAQHAADQLVRQFHLNPAHRTPRIFLHLAGQATPARLWLLAAGAILYAIIRFLEAYGLWHERRWAEWVAVISGGLYLPIEIWELSRGLTWPRLTLFGVNLLIVIYLARTLAGTRLRRRNLQAAAKGAVPRIENPPD